MFHNKKLKKCSVQSRDSIPEDLSEENNNTNSKDMSTPVCCSIITVAKIRKQPKCPSIDEWIKYGVLYICGILAIIKMKSCHLKQHGGA